LEVKEHDEGLRKGELELKERDELEFKGANAELTSEPQFPKQQQQVLKGSQQMLKESVSHTITLGLKDIQIRLLQAEFKGMMSAVPYSLKADQRKPDEGRRKFRIGSSA
jgi:hypothetical protein